jgi:hypothetical protein
MIIQNIGKGTASVKKEENTMKINYFFNVRGFVEPAVF